MNEQRDDSWKSKLETTLTRTTQVQLLYRYFIHTPPTLAGKCTALVKDRHIQGIQISGQAFLSPSFFVPAAPGYESRGRRLRMITWHSYKVWGVPKPKRLSDRMFIPTTAIGSTDYNSRGFRWGRFLHLIYFSLYLWFRFNIFPTPQPCFPSFQVRQAWRLKCYCSRNKFLSCVVFLKLLC
jgi:hypothetical protein